MNTCKTCNKQFNGKTWQTQCFDCYRDFKGMARIEIHTPYKGIFIKTHPNVSEPEVNAWIEKHLGSVNTPENWGAVEVTGKNIKLWYNCQNSD